MLKSDFLELIAQGEGAKLEFMSDSDHAEDFAKEIVAFANMNGGTILAGVEDDRSVIGVTRENFHAWIMDDVIGKHVYPTTLPDYKEIEIEGKRVVVVKIHKGVSKPYVFKKNDREDVYLRYGDVCQVATREQQIRIFTSCGVIAAEEFPVHGSSIEDLDKRRYSEYFERVLGETPISDYQQMLVNRSFLADDDLRACSYFAYALFGKQPGLRLPQSSVRITVYSGEDKSLNGLFDKTLDVPFLEYFGFEPALHDRLISFIKPYIKEDLQGVARKRVWHYPIEAVKELIINALMHRDWSSRDYVRIVVYSNRLDVISPGGLPNGMTIEKIKSGNQVSRNPKCVRIFRDYGYAECSGTGIRCKVIPLVKQHNLLEPIFETTDERFKVTLTNPHGESQHAE